MFLDSELPVVERILSVPLSPFASLPMRFISHNIASMLTSVQEGTVLHSRLHDSIVSSREVNVTAFHTSVCHAHSKRTSEGKGYLDANFSP
jgi:hypothetical protein